MKDSISTQWADRIGRLLGRRARKLARRMGTAFLTPLSFALNSGHFKSAFAEKALSRRGKAIPWFTYPAIDFLVTRDFSASSILEFGGRQSTIFWGRVARDVTTFETDAGWIEEIKRIPGRNTEVYRAPVELKPQEAFVRQTLDSLDKKFDVIIVDGLHRSLMFEIAAPYLADGGMIICDNAEGYGFYEAWQEFPGFTRVDFYGHAPGVIHPHVTSILFSADSDHNCKFTDNKNPVHKRAYYSKRMPYLDD